MAVITCDKQDGWTKIWFRAKPKWDGRDHIFEFRVLLFKKQKDYNLPSAKLDLENTELVLIFQFEGKKRDEQREFIVHINSI